MGSLILLLPPTCHPGGDLNGAPHPAGVGHWLLKVVQVRWFIVLILLVIVLVLGVVITTTAEVSRSTVAAAAVAAVAAGGLGGAAGRGDVCVGEDVAELVLEVVEVSGSR